MRAHNVVLIFFGVLLQLVLARGRPHRPVVVKHSSSSASVKPSSSVQASAIASSAPISSSIASSAPVSSSTASSAHISSSSVPSKGTSKPPSSGGTITSVGQLGHEYLAFVTYASSYKNNLNLFQHDWRGICVKIAGDAGQHHVIEVLQGSEPSTADVYCWGRPKNAQGQDIPGAWTNHTTAAIQGLQKLHEIL